MSDAIEPIPPPPDVPLEHKTKGPERTISLRRFFLFSVIQFVVTVALVLSIGRLAGVVRWGGSKITKENADKIQKDMDEDAVRKLLGDPTESAQVNVPNIPGMPKMPDKQSIWKDGNKVITVAFLNGKVAAKTFTEGAPVATEVEAPEVSSAKAVAEPFIAAVRNQDGQNAFALISEAYRQRLPKKQFEAKQLKFEMRISYVYAHLIENARLLDNNKQVVITGIFKSRGYDGRTEFTVIMTKGGENDRWLVDVFTSTGFRAEE